MFVMSYKKDTRLIWVPHGVSPFLKVMIGEDHLDSHCKIVKGGWGGGVNLHIKRIQESILF